MLVASEAAGGFSGALGALNDSNDPNGDRREAHANLYYEELRRSKPEPILEKLSKNAGISVKAARRVYEHVFTSKHNLGGEVLEHFDPSYDMAESFRRLLSGDHIQKHDLILVRHEWMESGLMSRYGIDYRKAHDKICEKDKYNYDKALKEWLKERGE